MDTLLTVVDVNDGKQYNSLMMSSSANQNTPELQELRLSFSVSASVEVNVLLNL
jgi:hypothetical protein